MNNSAKEQLERSGQNDTGRHERMECMDDVIDCIDSPDFYSILEDYLDHMPHTRKSAEELLDTVSGWELLEVYDKLLTEFGDVLTLDEIMNLKSDYQTIFSLPLPGE